MAEANITVDVLHMDRAMRMREALVKCLAALATLEREGETRFPETVSAAANAARAALAQSEAQPSVSAEMVKAYLNANRVYWQRIDSEPEKLGIWRNGTAEEATEYGLRAALTAACPPQAQPTASDGADELQSLRGLRVKQEAQPSVSVEPVAWRFAKSFWSAYDSIPVDLRPHLTALYESAPAAPAYAPLSDEDIEVIAKATSPTCDASLRYDERRTVWDRAFARAIEKLVVKRMSEKA